MAKFFQPIRKVLRAIQLLDIDRIALDISRNNVLQTLVIKLNTEGFPSSQLFQKGEDRFGQKLKGNTIVTDGNYTPFTKEIKREKGQPTDRVTLKDTGDFYMSFRVIPFRGGFEITADGFKQGDISTGGNTDLLEEFGNDILGLNQENLQIIINYYREAISEKIKQKLRAA